MKRFLALVSAFLALICFSLPLTACKRRGDMENAVVAERSVIGAGGYGAVFGAQIDPFDSNCYSFICDMGSLYFSYNSGKTWQRHNIKGTVLTLTFDPSSEGVVWAGGSGIYKSVDHGKTIKRVFPDPEDVFSEGHNYENANQWIYAKDDEGNWSDYLPQYQIWGLAVNRASQGKNVFAAQRVNSYNESERKINIFSTDDGEHFKQFAEAPYSYDFELGYDETNDCLVVVTPDKIYEYNSRGEMVFELDIPIYLHHRNGNVLSFDSYYNPKTGKNTFVFSTTDGKCYKTNDLRNKNAFRELVAPLTALDLKYVIDDIAENEAGYKSNQYNEWINGFVKQQFDWTICNVSVQSDDVVYLYHEAYTPVYDKNGNETMTRRTLAYVKYDERKGENERYKWVFGFPHKGADKETNNTWQDADSGYCYGFSSTPENENALLFGTITGIFHTTDGKNISQLHSNVVSVDTLTAKSEDGATQDIVGIKRVVTTGVDVYCTQKVAIDPFDSNHVLMGSTDIGLLQSYDNCKSWYHSMYGWENGKLRYINYDRYNNTCFDLHFDKYRKDVVYAVWSQKQYAPYSPDDSFFTSLGKFGVSYDGGISWHIKNIRADGYCVPYRMQVEYDGDNRIIYIATFSHGFYVSRDGGETFSPLNDGIPTMAFGNGRQAIFGSEILNCKMGLFAITGPGATSSKGHALYKWDNGENKFKEIALPTTEYNGKQYKPAAIRDIVYDDKNDCLYLACIATPINNGGHMRCKGGGVWKYKDGQFTQIYDDARSVFGVNIDSSGRLYATLLEGEIVRFKNNNTEYYTLIDGLFHMLKNTYFGVNDNVLYVTSWGGGTERITLKAA